MLHLSYELAHASLCCMCVCVFVRGGELWGGSEGL